MKYRNPKCKCGKPLYLEMDATVTEKIRNGKRDRKTRISEVDMTYLSCRCGRQYEYTHNKYNKIVRGEEI